MYEDEIGKKYNMLTILEYVGKNKDGRKLFKCKCDCGKEVITQHRLIKNGNSKSCGCYNLIRIKLQRKKGYPRTINGKATRLNTIYNNMKLRCYNKNSEKYKFYGARGIKICDEWLGENGFNIFSEWAIKNGYEECLTIDRIDNNGNYEPLNCRWIDLITQNKNRRNSVNIEIEGVLKNRKDWCFVLKLDYEKTRHIKPLEVQINLIKNKYKEMNLSGY